MPDKTDNIEQIDTPTNTTGIVNNQVSIPTVESVSSDMGVEMPVIIQPPTISQVYSADNIQEAVSSPQKTPNYSKLSADKLAKEIANAQNKAELEQLNIGNQTLNMGVISGQQAHSQRLSDYHINALSRLYSVKQDELNRKEEDRNKFISLYGADPESRPKGMSKEQFAKALQSGQFSNLLTEGFKQDQLDSALKRKQLAGGGTAGEIAGAALASAQDKLLSSRGSDLKVDPNIYISERAKYMRSGGTASEFDTQFGGLLSSQEQSNLGLQTQETKPLSAEANKQYQTAQSGLRALDLIEQQSSRGNLIQEALPGALGAREYRTNIREAMDAISRLRTGAALTANEEKFYRQQLPQAFDSQDTINRKIQNLRDFFEGISRENGDSNNNSNNDPLGLGF